MPEKVALLISNMLEKYYQTFHTSEKIVKELDLYSIVQSFRFPSEIGDYLLNESLSELNLEKKKIVLNLKDEDESRLLSLGNHNYLFNHFDSLFSSFFKVIHSFL